jgi:large subunit ribosomal protein L22
MPYRAVLKHSRISPRKARLVADLIRGKDLEEAYTILSFTRKRAAPVITKVLRSAAANARRSPEALDTDDLYIRDIRVDKGVTLKRWQPRAMGRAFPIHRPTSHITVILEEKS